MNTDFLFFFSFVVSFVSFMTDYYHYYYNQKDYNQVRPSCHIHHAPPSR